MQQLGLIATNQTHDGEEVVYYRPDDPTIRSEAITMLMRTYRYVDRLLRGY